MANLKTFSACLLALALHNAAWAEIYETKDAEGNTVFTDSPPSSNAVEIDLQQTNIADAPPPGQPQQPAQPQQSAPEQAPMQEGNTVIIHDNPEDQLEDGYWRRERGLEAANPETPHEVIDGEAPREVGDSIDQMPREVGDFDAARPGEAGDVDAIEQRAQERVEHAPAHNEAHMR